MLALIFSFVAMCFAVAAWFKAGEALRVAEDALFTAALTKAPVEMAAWRPDA